MSLTKWSFVLFAPLDTDIIVKFSDCRAYYYS